eukprot:COSAG03_NODE_14377_length_466_cov_1.269755_1_plen_26_part_10
MVNVGGDAVDAGVLRCTHCVQLVVAV